MYLSKTGSSLQLQKQQNTEDERFLKVYIDEDISMCWGYLLVL